MNFYKLPLGTEVRIGRVRTCDYALKVGGDTVYYQDRRANYYELPGPKGLTGKSFELIETITPIEAEVIEWLQHKANLPKNEVLRDWILALSKPEMIFRLNAFVEYYRRSAFRNWKGLYCNDPMNSPEYLFSQGHEERTQFRIAESVIDYREMGRAVWAPVTRRGDIYIGALPGPDQLADRFKRFKNQTL